MKILAHAAHRIRRPFLSLLLIVAIATAGVTTQPRDAWAPTAVSYAILVELLAVVAVTVATTVNGHHNDPLSAPMSCPVFGGSGTIVGEDSCAWAKAAGAWTSQSGTNETATVFRMGGQKEVAPDWFVGGALGAGTHWTQDGNGSGGNGQVFDGSLALKHTIGPWLFAGALALSSSATHLTPAATNLSGDVNVYTGGLRLRGAYDFAFDGWYLRPRLDLDLLHTVRPGFQLSGGGVAGLSVDGATTTSFVATPMLELGGRIDLDAAGDNPFVLRPYVAVGASFLPDNNSTVTANFTGPFAGLGAVQSTSAGPSVLGNLEAGLQLYRKHGVEVKAEYMLSAGDNYLSQGTSLRGAYHF